MITKGLLRRVLMDAGAGTNKRRKQRRLLGEVKELKAKLGWGQELIWYFGRENKLDLNNEPCLPS